MKAGLIGLSLFLSSAFLCSQTTPADAAPGIAGHPGCKSYFSVMWLDGVPGGKTEQATHYGLSKEQLDWWTQEGQKRSKTLCYLPQPELKEGAFKAGCAGCSADWQNHFRWLVLEHRTEKDKRTSISERTISGREMSAGPVGRATATAIVVSAGDPSTKMDYEIQVVSTDIAVYEGGNPVRPPSGQDHQLFYYSARKDQSRKGSSEQILRNDRQALQAAVQFIANNAKH